MSVRACCRSPVYSVFFAGDLEGVEHEAMLEWVKPRAIGVQHVIKKTTDRYVLLTIYNLNSQFMVMFIIFLQLRTPSFRIARKRFALFSLYGWKNSQFFQLQEDWISTRAARAGEAGFIYGRSFLATFFVYTKFKHLCILVLATYTKKAKIGRGKIFQIYVIRKKWSI